MKSRIYFTFFLFLVCLFSFSQSDEVVEEETDLEEITINFNKICSNSEYLSNANKASFRSGRTSQDLFGLILGIILFPNLFILISPYSPYDGLRLFLFIIPFICIIPSLLIFFVYKKIKNNNSYKIIFSILIFLKVFLLFKNN